MILLREEDAIHWVLEITDFSFAYSHPEFRNSSG